MFWLYLYSDFVVALGIGVVLDTRFIAIVGKDIEPLDKICCLMYILQCRKYIMQSTPHLTFLCFAMIEKLDSWRPNDAVGSPNVRIKSRKSRSFLERYFHSTTGGLPS